MPLQVKLITGLTSLLALARIRSEAFANNTLNKTMLPSCITDAALQSWYFEREVRDMRNPLQQTVAVIDSELVSKSEEGIIAYGKWEFPSCLLMGKDGKELGEEDLGPHPVRPDGTNENIWNAFRESIDGMRGKWGNKREVFELHSLATHPYHQRRGAAGLLLRWGIEQADAAGKKCYLECTPEAFPVYSKYGWKQVDEIRLDLSEFGGGRFVIPIMVREPDCGFS